eukprot:TRINITY_DN27175_c0_g1_i1.p1 TRINITY_DN27175_c0_g1~~TRINITY_DN27175_c0_g1_i1.p1  ORF type:complete len:228 (-),score=57.69 TRINITY_DN27175_c0_g1_i1:81-764(-)
MKPAVVLALPQRQMARTLVAIGLLLGICAPAGALTLQQTGSRHGALERSSNGTKVINKTEVIETDGTKVVSYGKDGKVTKKSKKEVTWDISPVKTESSPPVVKQAAVKEAPCANSSYPMQIEVQEAVLFHEESCVGMGTRFRSSSNFFLAAFAPYVRNLTSVNFCGKGIFVYYATPDMDPMAILGRVTRCSDKEVMKGREVDMQACTCHTLPPEKRNLVSAMTIKYC